MDRLKKDQGEVDMYAIRTVLVLGLLCCKDLILATDFLWAFLLVR